MGYLIGLFILPMQSIKQLKLKNPETKYFHYSSVPVKKIDLRVYRQNNLTMKPTGFWFSKNSEWIDWCESEGVFLCKETANTLELCIDFDGILQIDSMEKLEWFKSHYGIVKNIDWGRVANDYDGIYFDNYYEIRSELRLKRLFNEYLWYFGIDVNSGCIFNVGKIMHVIPANILNQNS